MISPASNPPVPSQSAEAAYGARMLAFERAAGHVAALPGVNVRAANRQRHQDLALRILLRLVSEGPLRTGDRLCERFGETRHATQAALTIAEGHGWLIIHPAGRRRAGQIVATDAGRRMALRAARSGLVGEEAA